MVTKKILFFRDRKLTQTVLVGGGRRAVHVWLIIWQESKKVYGVKDFGLGTRIRFKFAFFFCHLY